MYFSDRISDPAPLQTRWSRVIEPVKVPTDCARVLLSASNPRTRKRLEDADGRIVFDETTVEAVLSIIVIPGMSFRELAAWRPDQLPQWPPNEAPRFVIEMRHRSDAKPPEPHNEVNEYGLLDGREHPMSHGGSVAGGSPPWDWTLRLSDVPLTLDGLPVACNVTVNGLAVAGEPWEFRTVPVEPYVAGLKSLLDAA